MSFLLVMHAHVTCTTQLVDKIHYFILQSTIKLLLSLSPLLAQIEMNYNATAAVDKLTCTDFVDFGKYEDRFGRISWSKVENYGREYLQIQLKVFRKDESGEYKKHQQLNMSESDFRQFVQLRNHLAVAVRNFTKEEELTPIVFTTQSKDMDDQLKQVHRVIDVVDRPTRKVTLTMKRYHVENAGSTYVQLRLFTRKTEEEKFQQVVYVNYKLDEFYYLLDVIQSVCDVVISNQTVCPIV